MITVREPRTLAPVRSTPARGLILLAVALGTFMTYLDNNVVNVAIPTIERSLRLSESGIEWVVSAYILVFAGLLLAGGRLADVIGRKRLFGVGLTVFTGASMLAGLAGSADLLIGSRALQGLGAALLTPTTLAIISATFSDERERARAVGVWGAVGALALAVGPVIGGSLAEHASWHWIFFLNGPVGVVTFALGMWAIPADRPGRGRRLDWAGVTTSAVSLLALTYGLIQGPHDGWTSSLILGAFAFAVLAAGAFVAIERRVADPMVELSLFANRTFAGGTIAVMLWAFGLFGIYFYTSLYLQNVLGFSPTVAGVAFVPMALLMAVGATVSDRVSAHFGAYRVIGTAMAAMAVGIVSVSLLGLHAHFAELMPGLALIGVGGGLTIPLTSVVVGTMPPERAGVASGLFNASREVAGLLGITVIGVVLTARQTAAAHAHASTVVAFLDGYRLGLVVAAGLVAAGGAVAWFALPRPSATSRVGSSPRTDGVVLLPLGGLGEQDAQPFG